MVQLIRIATRKSALALWQAGYIKQQLEKQHAHIKVELVPILTTGDQIPDISLTKIGGKGLFVKQLELALLRHEADMAVHSMKDLPYDLPEGLTLSGICAREDARDAFLSNHYASLDELPSNAKVGTSSLRRQSQLKANYPFICTNDLRGNIDTRLAKLDQGNYDAIILAIAGLKRLGLTHRITQALDIETVLPAVGQGAIGIETRENDTAIQALLYPLRDKVTEICLAAERSFNKALQGNCQVPIGAYATLNDDTLFVQAMVGSKDGSRIIRQEKVGPASYSKTLGYDLAMELLNSGAREILDDLMP